MTISISDEYSAPLFTATAEDTVADNADQVVDSTSGTFFTVYVDNSANASTQVYVKLWDNNNASNVTVGTTDPDWIFPVAGGKTKQFCFPDGFAYGTGLVMACTTTAGTGGTSAPASDVLVLVGITT